MEIRTAITENNINRARKIKLLLMDCDGVLTDGKLYYSSNGEELKAFNVKDGQGIVSWHNAGFHSGIISGRDSSAVEKRALELKMSFIKQGSHNKVKDFYDILKRSNLSIEEVAFIGDDDGDIELLKIVGFSACVADAVDEVKRFVNYITSKDGGDGAVRELVNTLLISKNQQMY